LRALERKKKEEEKKQAEYERKQENKKAYEEDQAKYTSNKQNNSTKLTRTEIQKRQQQLLLKTLAKAAAPNKVESSSEEEKHEFDDDDDDGEYRYKLKPNVNHLMREQAENDREEYAEVIDARGIDDAINKLGDGQIDKHPEKRARAAFQRYLDEQMPLLKAENPTFKRSQLLDLIHKNWKKAPENPFNQTHLEYNEKK